MTDALPRARFEDGAFHFPVRVFYEDTDFSGFVYHANYVKFFERGRSEALRTTGVTHRDLLAWDPPTAMVVRRMEVEFLKPAVVEDDLVVHTVFEPARGARMMASQSITRAGEILATAKFEAVLIGLDGRPRRMPRELADKFTPFIRASTP